MNDESLTDQIEAVEISMEQARASIKMSDAFDRLVKNPDFEEVISKGYLEAEASRLVLIKADPSMQGEVEQKAIMDGITAIGNVRQYFIKIRQMGAMAKRALADDEQTLDELRNEG